MSLLYIRIYIQITLDVALGPSTASLYKTKYNSRIIIIQYSNYL